MNSQTGSRCLLGSSSNASCRLSSPTFKASQGRAKRTLNRFFRVYCSGAGNDGNVASERDPWTPSVPRAPPLETGNARPPPRKPSPSFWTFWLPGDRNLRTRRAILVGASVVFGSLILRKSLPESAEPPRVFVDDKGQRYLKTEGGTFLALYEDEQGRPYFLDPKGNLWYDSGDPQIGMHRISPEGDVYALWEDQKTGEVMESRLGNIDRDLVDVKTKEFGDITVFKNSESQDIPPLCKNSEGDLEACLDSSGNIRKDRSLEYPEVVLEGQIKNLQRRNRLFGSSKRIEKGDKDINTFNQGEIGPLDLGLFD